MYPEGRSGVAPRRDITERTFAFGVEIIVFCEALGKVAGARRMIAGQLLRAGTSVGANVEEAQGAQGRKDFIAKMSIALKEAREARYWLRSTFASKLFTNEPVPALIQEATELCNILAAIIVTARRNAGEACGQPAVPDHRKPR
jgi:four helix bundle protein